MLARTLSFCPLLLLSIVPSFAQDLPHGVPEKEGVSAAAISRFLDATTQGKTEFHSFVFLRHGMVVAEGWWNPYGPDLKHTLYSTSKSFTAAAIGFALTEGRLHLTDKVVSFFPNDLPSPVPPFLAELTVKDALMMSDGMAPDPTVPVALDSNWARKFLSIPIVNEPGTKFLYNSAGTYMLSAIISKVTGQPVLDYLKPRLFEPLGITGEDWETSPQGAEYGRLGPETKDRRHGQIRPTLFAGRQLERQSDPAAILGEGSHQREDHAGPRRTAIEKRFQRLAARLLLPDVALSS